MIPTIGVMIGMYIVTRMVEMLVYDDRKTGTYVLGLVTVVVAVFGMLNLLMTGAAVPALPR